MDFNLKGKIIIITGGAGLLGQEFCKAVVQDGGIAVIADINETVGEAVRVKLSSELNSKNICFEKLNITDEVSINTMIDNLKEKFGKIDGLVNNAYPRNKNYGKKFEEVKYEDFCENTNMHVGGYFLVSQQISNFFKTQGFGNIINISSIYGVIAPKFEIYDNTQMTMPVEYAVIKSAVIHLTKYMAKYFKGTNIRVNSLSPGGIFDGQNEKFIKEYNKNCLTKGMLDKKDITGTLLFLLSDHSKYINGQNLIVDDGFTL